MTLYEGRFEAVVEAPDEDGYRGPKDPGFDHLVEDLWGGLEEGNFRVETPRVCVGKAGFDKLHISKTFGEHAHARGPPLCELDLEWHSVDGQLAQDLIETKGVANSVVLYGAHHVWSINSMWRCELNTGVEQDTNLITGDTTFAFREAGFDWVGWR